MKKTEKKFIKNKKFINLQYYRNEFSCDTTEYIGRLNILQTILDIL